MRTLHARVDRLRSRTRSGPRFVGQLAPASFVGGPPATLAAGCAAGSIAGAALWGTGGGLAGVLVGVGACVAARARRGAWVARAIEEGLPGAVRAIADALRSGANVPQALDAAAQEAPPPLAEALRAVLREQALGIPAEQAVSALAARTGVPGLALLAIALRSGARSGADLPPVLDGIAESARDRARLRREMRAATAQGRLTALVIGSLPVAFLLVLGAGAKNELRFLTHEPAGWALLAAGATLEAVGFWWMRRLVRVS